MSRTTETTWLSARAAEVRRHPLVAAGLLITATGTLWHRADQGVGGKAVVYLGAMLAAALLVDVVAAREGPPPRLPVRRPAQETAVLLTFTSVGAAWIIVAKCVPAAWNELPRLARIAGNLIGAACLFQIASAAYLLVARYRPADLGVRLRGLLVAPAVLVLVASAALVADPDHITLPQALAEWGWAGLTNHALFGEPLVEEFLRMALQSRVGVLLGNSAAGWFLAALPWSLLHVPMWYAKSGDLSEAFAAALCIVPIGLLWSYVTVRTGSLVPAVLIHGFNLWGLQNA